MVTSYLDKQCIFLTLIGVAEETPHYGCEKKDREERERKKKKTLVGFNKRRRRVPQLQLLYAIACLARASPEARITVNL